MPASPRASSSNADFKVELTLTPNSRSQRDGLAAGTFDVVHSAVDNALAMIEIGQARRGDRNRRRQRNERVLRAGGDQFLRRSARPHAGGRRARHRLCAAGEKNPGAARAQGREGLHGQAGRRRRLPPQGDGGEQGQYRRHSQSAVHRAGGRARHEESRAHHRPARPLPGERRVPHARLGARARRGRSSATSPPISRRCASCAIP